MSPYFTQASRYKAESHVGFHTLGEAREVLLRVGLRVSLPPGVEEALTAKENREAGISIRLVSFRRRVIT